MADSSKNAGRAFDAYEIIGIISPGTVIALLVTLEWAPFRTLLGDKGLSIGDVGLFALVAYIFGHLVQAIGNVIESVIWLPSGLPSSWIRSANQRLVTGAQRTAFAAAVSNMEGGTNDISIISRKDLLAITSRAYGRLRVSGRSGRVDIANRAYGLSRGLSGALLVWVAWYSFDHSQDHSALLILSAALCASILRMRRAGIQYARALILDFIDIETCVDRPGHL